jgi:hypothetical protein
MLQSGICASGVKTHNCKVAVFLLPDSSGLGKNGFYLVDGAQLKTENLP